MTDINEKTIERIKSAVGAGMKIRTIAENTSITYYRMASVVNPKSYRQSTSFSDDECKQINNALDKIKSSF